LLLWDEHHPAWIGGAEREERHQVVQCGDETGSSLFVSLSLVR